MNAEASKIHVRAREGQIDVRKAAMECELAGEDSGGAHWWVRLPKDDRSNFNKVKIKAHDVSK